MLSCAGLMSMVVLGASGGAWTLQDYVLGQIQRVNAFGGLSGRPEGGPEGAMNILVAGVDRRAGLSKEVRRKLRLGHQEGERSDTMMVVHLSERHDRATVVSLPRDSLVTIPAHRDAQGRPIPEQLNKLNAAFSWGGHKLAIQTVERNTGIRIDHYVEVNFLGFIRMVDALGGVEVCTPTAINDRRSGLSLSPGKHMVDGATALAYVRTRYSLTGGSDLGRVRRQQQFMGSMMRRALSTQTLSSPAKLSAFLNASLASVRLDEGLSKERLTRLAEQLKDIPPANVTFTTVPIASADTTIKDLGSVARWDAQRAAALFQKIKRDEPITVPAPPQAPSTPPEGGAGAGRGLTVPPHRIQVRVLNGTDTQGLGAKAASALEQAGFLIDGPPANAARSDATRTIIQYGSTRRDSARTLRAAIPGARLREVPELGSRIQVIVGSSWQGATKIEVGAAQGAPSGPAGRHEPGQVADATNAAQATCN